MSTELYRLVPALLFTQIYKHRRGTRWKKSQPSLGNVCVWAVELRRFLFSPLCPGSTASPPQAWLMVEKQQHHFRVVRACP